MHFKENRKLAFCVLIVVILFSVLVQGSVALLNARGDTEVLFMEGDLHPLMHRCADSALLLGQSGGLYLNDAALKKYASAETAGILADGGYTDLPAQLETLSAALTDAADPNESLAVLAELRTAVEKTYTGLDMLDIADADFRDLKLAYYDFTGGLDILARDGENKGSYAVHARKFNKQISRFPANLFAAVLHVEPLTIYGG